MYSCHGGSESKQAGCSDSSCPDVTKDGHITGAESCGDLSAVYCQPHLQPANQPQLFPRPCTSEFAVPRPANRHVCRRSRAPCHLGYHDLFPMLQQSAKPGCGLVPNRAIPDSLERRRYLCKVLDASPSRRSTNTLLASSRANVWDPHHPPPPHQALQDLNNLLKPRSLPDVSHHTPPPQMLQPPFRLF